MLEVNSPKDEITPGLPKTVEEAIAQIDEIENSSSDNDWLPLDKVLDEIYERHAAYAS